MNDQHAWPQANDRVTLYTPDGPRRLILRSVHNDPQGIPYGLASDVTDTVRVTRRIDAFVRGWPT